VTRPKIRSSALLVFLDFHVGVAKGHALYPVAVRNVHHRFLLAVAGLALRNSARLVQCDALAFVRCHSINPHLIRIDQPWDAICNAKIFWITVVSPSPDDCFRKICTRFYAAKQHIIADQLTIISNTDI